MTYPLLNLPFLVVAAALLAAALVARPVRRAPRVRALFATGIVLLVMTAVFDNVMIAVRLVGYDPARITGLKIGIAPVEDFAYAIAVVLLLPALWMLLPDRRAPAVDAAPTSGARPAPDTPAPDGRAP